MNQPRRYAGPLVAVCLLGTSLAMAGAPRGGAIPRYGVAVYSDLCLDADSGDIGGQRISLHRYADGDSLFYEYTAGALSQPVVASDIDIDDNRGVLTFNVAGQDGRERTVVGRFTERGRTLTLDGGYCADASMPMRLSRVSDFSRPLKNCKACPPGQESPVHDAAAPEPVVAAPPAPAASADDDDGPTLEQQEQRQLDERARGAVREVPPRAPAPSQSAPSPAPAPTRPPGQA